MSSKIRMRTGKKSGHRSLIGTRFVQNYSDYIRDQAVLDTLCSVILSVFADVVGDEELEKLLHQRNLYRYDDIFAHDCTQYLDKCNIEYLKTAPE